MMEATRQFGHAALTYAVYLLNEPWAAAVGAAFVGGVLMDRRAMPLVQYGRVVVGAAVAWIIIRALQEVL